MSSCSCLTCPEENLCTKSIWKNLTLGVHSLFLHVLEFSYFASFWSSYPFRLLSPSSSRAYVYFSSTVSKDLLARIKNDTSVLPRIGALSEVTISFPVHLTWTTYYFGFQFLRGFWFIFVVLIVILSDEFGVFSYRHSGTFGIAFTNACLYVALTTSKIKKHEKDAIFKAYFGCLLKRS